MNIIRVKVKLIILLSIALIIISNLLVSNQRDIERFIGKNDANEEVTFLQPPRESSVYYEDTTGLTESVYVSGDYAYVANGIEGLAVINISDPANPGTPIYEDTTGWARAVYVSGDYAYVADFSSGLAVINISNPTNPGTPVYEATIGSADDLYVSGDYAYVAVGAYGLAVVNISDPTNPDVLVYEDTTGYASGIYVSGDYAYVADRSSGLAIINISDPTNPGTPVYETTTAWAEDVYVSGDYAYVADETSGMAVFNVSDPTNPGIPVYEDTTGDARGVYVSGDHAYVADRVSGLAVIDISDPTNPGIPVYEDTSGQAFGVYVSGDYAYVADHSSGLAVIDISYPISPKTPIYEDTNGYAYDVYVDGDYIYVATSDSGLAVIDISDPTNPGTPVYEDMTADVYGVYVSGDYAYVANMQSGLAVIDISDPTNPGTPIYEDTEAFAVDVYVSGDYAYVANAQSGLAVIDISDPTNPGSPNYADTEFYAQDVYVSGDYAYVTDEGRGLAIIDISDPRNPGTPVYANTTGNARGVYVSGNYAYVADHSSGLAVIDISDPRNPGTPVYQDTTGYAYSVYVSGDSAYVADYDKGLAIIDISDPRNPGTAVYRDTSGAAWDIYVCGDYVYVADTMSGLAVIQVRERFDMVDPIITNVPSDFTTESGYRGVNISWTAIDANPNTYTIELQGFGVVSGPIVWSNGTTIMYNVPNGLNVGEYFYTVNFTDNYDHFVTDTVKMTVEDTSAPIITEAQSDFNIDYGYEGVDISWIATDPNPNMYTIELQGFGIVAGPSAWSNGTTTTYNVPNGLALGEYIYTVNFTDDYDHFVTDTVKMTVEDIGDPIITIISPIATNNLFGTTAPSFSVKIDDIFLDTMWYTLNGGVTNKTFTTNESISQFLWESRGNGTVTIRFYANDTSGNINWEEIVVRKDILGPIITISAPIINEDFEVAPSYELSIDEGNLDKIWYTLDGGLTNITITSLLGTIEQAIWDGVSSGSVTITFYANDTLGNIGFRSVGIAKIIPGGAPFNIWNLIILGAIIVAISSIISLVIVRSGIKRKGIRVFVSHAMEDNPKYEIGKIAKYLKSKKGISKVYICEEDVWGNIKEWMDTYVPRSQLLIIFFTKNFKDSKACKRELELAFRNGLVIMPILGEGMGWDNLDEKSEELKVDISDEFGTKFDFNNPKRFKKELYAYAMRVREKIKEDIEEEKRESKAKKLK